MALQSSGQISFADINVELGRSSTAQIGINEAEAGSYSVLNQDSTQKPNGSTPNAIDEWYGYDHTVVVNTFDVSLGNSLSGPCGPGTIRTVKSTNNATGLAGAVGSALYRMPQNTLITGFTRVAQWDSTLNTTLSSIYNLNSTTGVVGSDTGYEC
jgi:hypothetical protein